MSIHKSQGSEFKAVVIPFSTQHFILLQRNLLYTALTRARQLCIFVGTRKALSIAVANNRAILRYSSLADELGSYAGMSNNAKCRQWHESFIFKRLEGSPARDLAAFFLCRS